jgi:type IV pilus assembly protein PilF
MTKLFRYLFYFLCASLLACGTIYKNHKTSANYNAQLGLAYLKQGDMKAAKSKLLLALQQSSNDPLILDSMAYFFETTGEVKLAENYYLQAIKRASKNGAVQNNYGVFLCRHKRYQESLDHFLLAVKDSSYLNTAQAYENAGLCALKIPNKKLAKEYMRKALVSDSVRRS